MLEEGRGGDAAHGHVAGVEGALENNGSIGNQCGSCSGGEESGQKELGTAVWDNKDTHVVMKHLGSAPQC